MIAALMEAAAAPQKPLWYVLLVFLGFSGMIAWLLVRAMEPARPAPPADRRAAAIEALLTDAALNELALGAMRMGPYYRECPGCLGHVHHTDLEVHARGCAPLRQQVAQRN